MKKQIRQIKLQPKYRSLSLRQTRVVPSLTLSGAWLEAVGFKAGAMVVVTIEQDQLTIKRH